MKSIGKIFRNQFAITAVALLFVFTLIGMLYYSIENYNNFLQKTSTIFSGLNKVFTTDTIDDSVIDLLDPYISQNKLAELKENQDLEGLQQEARRLAQDLQTLRNERILHIMDLIKLGLLTSIPLFLLILVLFVLSYSNVKKLLTTSKNMLIHFNHTLLEGSAGRALPKELNSIPYQEMREMGNFFQFNMDLMALIQDLLTMDLGFSIETFIDQFGKVFCSEKYQHILPCDRFSLSVYQENQDILVAYHATVRGDRPVFLQRGFSQKLSDSSLKRIIDLQLPYRIINNLGERNSQSSRLLLQEGINANLTVPVMINQRLFGFLFFAHRQACAYTEEMGKIASLVSNIVRSRFYYSYALQKTLSVFGDGIVNIVEFKDDETADHTRRVSLYAELIANSLRDQDRITPQKADKIKEYAPLHDLGKIGIPDSILLKPGKLSPKEWNIMKQHPLIGGRIIRDANQKLVNQLGYGLLHTAYNLIIDHHEWWDGTGYPQGKQGMDISIEGQIVAIADVFDALTTKRPYKEAFPIDQSLTMIKEQGGTHFNPELVELFLEKRERILEIYEEHYVLG